jgi:hypothetical protein
LELPSKNPDGNWLERHIEHPAISIGDTLHCLLLVMRDESMRRPTRQRTMGFA